MIHVRYNGRSYDINPYQVDLPKSATNEQIKRQVAKFLEVKESTLRFYVIDRRPNGNIIIRPEAVYG